MGWVGPAMSIGKMAMGGLSAIFGGGMSPEQKYAMQQMKAQTERANQFYQLAQGQANKVGSYVNPIIGGSRTAAMQALSPEVQGAEQRIESGRQSLLNLTSRSGGAAAMMDPYAKAMAGSNILMKARPQAAQAGLELAGQYGNWGGANNQGARSMFDAASRQRELDAERGGSFFKILNEGMGQFGDWWGNRKKGGGGGGSSINPNPSPRSPDPWGNM